jgi:hypothetical protein
MPSRADEPPQPPRRRGFFRRPPRFVFHGVLVLTGLVVLWAFSFPGVNFLAVLPCIWIVGIAALTWLVRAATYVWARRRGNHEGTALWFVVAPAGAVVLALLLYGNAPLRIRWQSSRSAFQRAVPEVQAHPSDWSGWHPRRVGMYTVTTVQVVGDDVIFYEKTGAFLDDAGFAYLPNGPSKALANGSFENPQWFALGGHWYAWTASW